MEPGTGTEIYINLIHFPVYTLGMGKRTGIWLQGCSIGCKGCISEHTWHKNENHKISVSDVLVKVKSFNNQGCGITLSGGEPFEQPEALHNLLINLKNSGFNDIMVYSGYRYNFLKKKYSQILALLDILVDGKFVEGRETDYIWKGSDNQNMIILTKNAVLRDKYNNYQKNKGPERKLQMITANDHSIHIIGIPMQKDSKVIKDGLF
jgi:anaerobic ribonucleoside-triphosphate reductase activating protein